MFNLFFQVSLGSIFGLVGGLLFLFNKKLSKILEKNAISFAAGVLLTVSFLGLLPESVELIGQQAYLFVLASFFVVFIFEKIIFEIHHHEENNHGHSHLQPANIWLVIIGDTVHNLIDGISIGASFLVSPAFGFVTAFSSFLHEVPHEVGDFGILLKAKWKKSNIVWANLISALATYVGAFSVYFFTTNDFIIGTSLSISAGIFLYLGAIDFLPQVVEKEDKKFQNMIPLFLGSAIMLAVFYLFPEH